MNISSIIEKWDSLLFSLYNIITSIKYFFEYLTIHKIISHNADLEDKYKDKRCFIVLNGPSINKHNLSRLHDEFVFATNYFYKSPLIKDLNPDFYCWLDAKIFRTDDGKNAIDEIKKVCPNTKFLLNYKAYDSLGNSPDFYYVYTKHIPNVFGVRGDLTDVCSNYSTVAFFAISSAIYMGFKKIYVLGLDFEPGGFTHFTNLGEGTECDRPAQKKIKDEVCGLHWGYSKAQFESYYIARFAKKLGIEIINLNPSSNIRAFDFENFENIIK